MQILLSILVLVRVVGAQEEVVGIEFLNERMRIPESELFDEGIYIESGVGLSFGVDKRLAYMPGEYEEAAQRFELSVRQFRYKAEVWVYLARAYFYMKSPDAARDALLRAEALMPDLRDHFWQPMLASLKSEIRQRALRQQAQIDFYSTGQDEVLSLFRLYLFLVDHDSARDLVVVAHGRARMMRENAQMVSGASRSAQAAEADRWQQLGERLADELQAAGIPVPPVAVAPPLPDIPGSEDIEEQERVRVLQLRVDFYAATEADFEQLFQAYIAQTDTIRARAVIASLERHITDLGVQASVAPTLGDQADIEERIDALKAMGATMRTQVGAETSDTKAGARAGGAP
ncbi:MAG: hypothetical protein O2782_12725 [bacterium]|nr:hypothetical protein [bacterium]